MKKLFLLLILSFFSAQSFAGSCPDGSEPIKSISDDGTYFVFNCSGNSENASQSNNSATTKEITQIEWVDGLYAKSITDEFNVLSKDFSKPGDSGGSMIIPLGSGDFSGDGVPEIVYGISYWDLKRGSQIKPIFITNTPGEGLSLFSPIMDVVPYVGETRDFIIEDLNGDGINDIFIADHGPDYDPLPGAQNLLILSAPNGKFINATLNLPQISDFSHGVTSGDIDSDGDIDLFVTQNGANFNIPHYFLINDGKGKFTKVPDGQLLDKSLSFLSNTSGNKRRNFYFDAGLEFVDDDDKLDLILLSGKLQGAENNRIVFGSNSGFKLKNAVELQPGRFNSRSIGVNYLLTDIDNDGDNDILILHATSSGHQWGGTDLQVLVQEENRKFIDKSDFYFPGVVFDYGTWGMYLNLIDLNNDDKKDIVITAFNGIDVPSHQQIGGQIKQAPPKVFIRQEDGSFRPLNNDLLTGGEKYTLAGIRPIDIDNDGDIEFVVQKNRENGFTVQVLELTTNKEEAMYYTGPTEIISSPLFDGRYSFTISRYNENEGSKRLGNGYIEINNGIMTVAKEGRTLDTGSIDLYDSFEGQIDKDGKISAVFNVNALAGKGSPEPIGFRGTIGALQIKGKFDHYYDVILKLSNPIISSSSSDPIISSPLFDGRYSFTISRYHDDEDWQELGSGFIQIKNGIMTVAKEGRTLDTGSIDLYDSFAGQINKKGNIMSSLKISVLTGVESPPLFLVDLNGSIDSPLQGKWDHYYDVILKLGKKE